MRNKGFILFFGVTFGLICLYSLSFTECTYRVEKKATEYAKNDPNISELQKQAHGDDFLAAYLIDSSFKARESEYLSLMSDSVIYNLLFAKWTYRDCKEREVNLGLDLKGGMNVVLEVSVPDIIRSLAGSGAKDQLFIQTMKTAMERQRPSQNDFITLFYQSFKDVAPENAKLSTIFRKLSINKVNPTNDDVIKALREETDAALDNAFLVLRSRIDRFGVAQPSIQRLPKAGRIMIELPGVKEPERVRKLLQGTANLEFWKTYELSEIKDLFSQANDRIVALKSTEKDTVEEKDETLAVNDTSAIGLPEVEDEEGELSREEWIAKNPLLSKLYLNTQMTDHGKLGALVGFCHERDTAEVNRMLNLDVVKNILPQDLRLCWHAKTGKDRTPEHRLIALKAVGEKGALMDGKTVVDARQDFNDRSGNEISMTMNADGARQWRKITEENKGHSIAIVLDHLVYSYPTVNDVIPNGRSSITGQFSLEEAKDLANLLKAGKLPAPAIIVSEEIVGPTLGKESIDSSITSFIIAFIFLLIFLFSIYNRSGVAATIALLVNILFIFGTLASLQAVLTLPGIAGIVLTVGMAIDANIIINERIKEEVRAGKALRLAISDGYSRALSAIVDGNLTTVITGVILYIFGSGPVQGFATTLIIGVLTSMFTAIFITRIIFNWVLDKNWKLSFGNKFTSDILAHTKIDFLSKRKYSYIVIGLILMIGFVSLSVKKLDLGIDFAGGRSYTVRFDKPVKTTDLRDAITKEFDGIAPEVKTFGSNNQVKITTKWNADKDDTRLDSIAEVKLYEALKPFFKANVTKQDFSIQNQNIGLFSSQKVGATVSSEMTRNAFLAVIFSLIACFIYIVIRFRNWQYGVGTVSSLTVIALFTIGMYSLFSGVMPFSMEVDQAFIAAILTVIGYSINDGIVIFDRVREYRKDYPKRDLKETINASLNSTLSRTIYTTGSTLMVLLTIFIFGGDVIRGFVFTLLIGIAFGGFSSIFIATPILFETTKKQIAKSKE